MNLTTITQTDSIFPWAKMTLTCTKPLPDLRSVEGKAPKLPPEILDRHSIFIVGQTEFTVDVLFINQGYLNALIQVPFDSISVVEYFRPIGIVQQDITHIKRVELTWSQVIDELDHARAFQDHTGYLKAFLDTIDYHQHVPSSKLEDREPLRLPSRFNEALTEYPHPIIELVMNDHDDGNLESILLEIIMRHNRFYGRPMAEHVRKKINDYSSARELSELISSEFRQHVMHQLFILDLDISINNFWNTFIWTQLTPFLIKIRPNTRILILNRNRESLDLEEANVSVFPYRSGLM